MKEYQFRFKGPWEDYFVTFKVDLTKFTEQVATDINSFWSNADSRLKDSGDDIILAALQLYAAEVLKVCSFNNFIGPEDVETIFTSGRDGYCTEGFPPPSEIGLEVTRVDVFHFTFDNVELVND